MGSVFTDVSVASVTDVSRYSTVKNEPTQAQVNPLLAIQQMRFSKEISTIEDAVKQWLRHTGYALADKAIQSKDTQEILKQALPQVDRELGPLTVKEGLEILVGKGVFHLVQDPLHRKVNFVLNKKYQQLFTNKARV
jgi:conjugative transfer region protein (TIGR03748 family)